MWGPVQSHIFRSVDQDQVLNRHTQMQSAISMLDFCGPFHTAPVSGSGLMLCFQGGMALVNWSQYHNLGGNCQAVAKEDHNQRAPPDSPPDHALGLCEPAQCLTLW